MKQKYCPDCCQMRYGVQMRKVDLDEDEQGIRHWLPSEMCPRCFSEEILDSTIPELLLRANGEDPKTWRPSE